MADRSVQSPEAREAERTFVERLLGEEARAVGALAANVGPALHEAVDLLERCAEQGGTVLVTGLGKSGLVGAKISATLSSLGIPSHSVHPSEAAHGDLGRFRPVDTVVCISASGETEEVVNLALVLRQDNLPIIAITAGPRPGFEGEGEQGDRRSSLERIATVCLKLGVASEAGTPEFVAPTSSTTATMALGDALALATARRRRFTHEDFARRHPGGALGGMVRPVTEVLRFVCGKNLPLIPHDVTVEEALRRAASAGRRPGAMVLVEPGTGRLTGIFTDGDLRRLVLRDPGELNRRIEEVMTRTPRTLGRSALVSDAVRMLREFRQDEVPVVDEEGRPVGLLDVQDLITMRLVRD